MKEEIKLLDENKKEIKKLEKLRLVCRKCSHEWIKTRPKGYHVRYNRRGNFLVNIKDRTDIRFFKCPKCGERKNIGRLAYSNKIKINENGIEK